MLIAITTISILVITGVVWLGNRVLSFKICPICAGVSGTWLWMLAAKLLGYEIDLIILAMLMGGSVVGMAYQIEKRLPPDRSPLLWKTIFISVGFVAVYSVISLAVSPSNLFWWTVLIVMTTILLIWTFRFTSLEARTRDAANTSGVLPSTGFVETSRARAINGNKVAHLEQSRKVKELEKKMEECC